MELQIFCRKFDGKPKIGQAFNQAQIRACIARRLISL
jgi:hypothetical protein